MGTQKPKSASEKAHRGENGRYFFEEKRKGITRKSTDLPYQGNDQERKRPERSGERKKGWSLPGARS